MLSSLRNRGQIITLQTFLKKNFPCDIIMPVVEKAPMFPHKDGAWTWKSFEDFKGKCTDIGVLLHTLCVVDVDTQAAVVALVDRFPILNLVPCERTTRGYHYWFIRPDNECMYFDGAAQVIPGVDFKSVHKNGTSGLVVVAPSAGKKWIRKLTMETLIEIPIGLLEAVARKTMSNVTRTLRFQCGETVEYTDNAWIGNMTHFDPSEEFGGTPFSTPCQRETFDNIMYVLDNNELGMDEPSREKLTEMIRVADMLGLTKGMTRLTNSLTSGVPRAQLDLYEANPGWWRAMRAEKNGQMDYMCESPSHVVPIDERFLFHESERFTMTQRHTTPLALADCDSIVIPSQAVNDILRLYPGKIVLAGGMAASIACPGMGPGHDNDLYFMGVDKETANVMLKNIVGKSKFHLTHNAVTFVRGDDIIQVILRLCDSPMKLIVGFDLPACKACIYFDGQSMVRVLAPTFLEAVRCGAFPVDYSRWAAASALRTMKYVMKGFDVFVPGLRRKALNQQGPLQGIASLMACERILASKPQTHQDLRFCKQLTLRESDYTDGSELYDGTKKKFKDMMHYIWGPKKLPMHIHMRTMCVNHSMGPMLSKCYDTDVLKLELQLCG